APFTGTTWDGEALRVERQSTPNTFQRRTSQATRCPAGACTTNALLRFRSGRGTGRLLNGERGTEEEEEEEEDGEEWQPSVQHCCGSGRRKMEPCKAPCRQPRVAVSAVQVRRQPAPPDILPPPEQEEEGDQANAVTVPPYGRWTRPSRKRLA
ncbi:unnamed protein product, partial [Prorocentrum cordatum]